MAQDAAVLQRPTEVVLLGTAGVGAVGFCQLSGQVEQVPD